MAKYKGELNSIMPETVVLFENVSRTYKLYDSPKDRLKEALHPFGKKRHRDFYALKNVSLEVKKGEVLGIVGRNGAGKSTLLMIASRVLLPSSGRVTIHGFVSAMLDLGAGMNPDFNGIQNIYFGGIMLGLEREIMRDRVDKIVAFADIGEFIYQPLKTYSSGMKARLGFALAASLRPNILVVDEVLSVGDELFRRKCFAKIDELIKTGCTVLFVSHSASSIIEICSRAILLDNGELILEGNPKLVIMSYQRLLFAAPGTGAKVREEIIRLNADENYKREFLRAPSPVPASPVSASTTSVPSTQANAGKTEPKLEAHYLPGFVPKTTVEYRHSDVDIADVGIQTKDGRRVNVLVTDEEYVYSYQVHFHLDLENVNFGMALFGDKGQILGRASYPALNKYLPEKFRSGSRYEVRCHFKCKLLPGTYFTTAAVRHYNGEKIIVLNRIRDASVFKVLPTPDMDKSGFFNFDQRFEIIKLSEPGEAGE